MEVLLGEGVLTWPRYERITDRYGSVGLIKTWETFFSPNIEDIVEFLDPPIGEFGQLIAEILEARRSPGVGDIARSIPTAIPDIGERIILGEGTLFIENAHIGVKPSEKREVDWLSPKALYRVHAQTVRLFFIKP